MSFKKKFRQFFFLDENHEEHWEEKTQSRQQMNPNNNVVSFQSVQKKASSLILVEPKIYADAQEIADHLKNNRTVVMNLQQISHEQAVRIVDFLSGTVYALGGDIQRIGIKIFVCTPDDVEVSGSISEMLDHPDLRKYQESEEVGWL